MRSGWTREVVIGLACSVLIAIVALYVRPCPARPVTPVPQIALAENTAFSARLVPWQQKLGPLPAAITGRAAPGPDGGYRHEWPAFHAVARFEGTSVSLRFDDSLSRWRVDIDGSAVEISRPGLRDLLIEGIKPGRHEIRAEKISESPGPALFGGFFINDAGRDLAPPEPAPRLIEFIGDSDTVGFANTAERRDCTEDEIYAATDTSRSFGPQVARALGADYRIIARSGIGLLRNYGGADPERTMGQLYPLALPADPQAPALPQRPADIIVIGLGSNVFGSPLDPQERWTDNSDLARDFGPALADFARARAQENPGALVVLLGFGEYGPELVEAHHRAAALLDERGIANRLVVLDKPQRNACLWHPSASDHAMIAEALLAALKDTAQGG